MRVVLAFAINTFFNFILGLLIAKFLGPEEYGRFALAIALAILLQTALLDWLKLAATRFYSNHARFDWPALRASLDASYVGITMILVIGAIVVTLIGIPLKPFEVFNIRLELSAPLVGLSVIAAVANGLFDYNTALVRARFLDRDYARLVIIKNIAAFFLTGGGAFIFHSAIMTLTGACLAISGSVFSVRHVLRDAHAPMNKVQSDVLLTTLAYTLPIAAASVLYQIVPLFNRAGLAGHFGFAESGQFSLAYDIGMRVVAAIGSSLDVLLFQIAVAADEKHGALAAKQQLSRNMAVILAMLAPACLGMWLVLPSLESVIVPEEFRGPFSHYLTILLPGMFCYAIMAYAVNPIFQIAKFTRPLILAAIGGCLAYLLALQGPWQSLDASIYAYAQDVVFIAALLILLVFALFAKAHLLAAREILSVLAGLLAMTAALLPLRIWSVGPVTLLLQVIAGMLVYGASVLLCDTAGLRTALFNYWRARQMAKSSL